ncbi:MAG: phosphoribosylanthranilate isomerase [Planctomyces sp.]|nr:phosphoribosylanthranilate isomerase [Planctomyces sp.]
MWVKICGIRSLEDAEATTIAGADAVGLNFYPSSKRYISPAEAGQVVKTIQRVSRQMNTVCPDIVGLFVNATRDVILETIRVVGITAVQLHGDESPEFVQRLADEIPEISLIRAYRIDEQNAERVISEAERMIAVNGRVVLLMDAFIPGEYGGTGHSICPHVLKELRTLSGRCRLIIAGGLKPENLEQLFQEMVPWGIDTASGVESRPGIKDAVRVRAFIAAARSRQVNPVPFRLTRER